MSRYGKGIICQIWQMGWVESHPAITATSYYLSDCMEHQRHMYCGMSTIRVYLWKRGEEESPWVSQKEVVSQKNATYKFFSAPLISSRIVALCEGHVYCLWPLPCILLVCTTSVCLLFVVTPMYTISVHNFSVCTLL